MMACQHFNLNQGRKCGAKRQSSKRPVCGTIACQSGPPGVSVSEPSSHAFRSVARALSLSDKVAEQLTEAILSRQLAPGERLPSERELGEKFNVSRTVVREAVRSLAARGLVRVTSGRGV